MAKSGKSVRKAPERTAVYFVIPQGQTVAGAVQSGQVLAGPCPSKSEAMERAQNTVKSGGITAGDFALVMTHQATVRTFSVAPVQTVAFIKN